jgi:hypothetical protein
MRNPKNRDKSHCCQKKSRKQSMPFVKSINSQHGEGDGQIKIHADGGPIFKIVDYPPVYLVPFKRHANAFLLKNDTQNPVAPFFHYLVFIAHFETQLKEKFTGNDSGSIPSPAAASQSSYQVQSLDYNSRFSAS